MKLNILTKKNISILDQSKNLEEFFKINDFIIPSPGIDLKLYEKIQK